MKKSSIGLESARHAQLTLFCATLSNASRIAILEALACNARCKEEIQELGGRSAFTVGVHLKYLKKHGLVKGSFTSKNTSYCLEYERFSEFKQVFDEFCDKVTRNRKQLQKGLVSCGNPK